MRSFGQAVVQRVTLGYRFDRRRSLVPPDFPIDPANPDLAAEFLATWAPLPETRSEPYLRYQLFTARYGVFRDLDTFDLRENRRLGPLLAVEVAAGLPALGADFVGVPDRRDGGLGGRARRVRVRPGAGDGVGARALGRAHRSAPGRRCCISRRRRSRTWRAWWWRRRTDAVRADTYRTRFFLGGDTGLRGYQIGEFQGTVAAAAHAEIRTAPLAAYSQRFGAILFYDVGHAAASYDALVPHHDFGVGLRWLIPQLNASVVRIDWAIATDAGPYTRPGLPGRITAGFAQSFWLLDSPKGYLPLF